MRSAYGRFLAKVTKSDSCWLWTGATVSGYGSFFVDGQTVLAHRWVYEQLIGPVPDGLVLDHLCRNRPCVNPAHLEPVTNRENILRGTGFSARNAAKSHCRRSHPLSGSNLLIRNGQRRCLTCKRELARKWIRVWRATKRVGRSGAPT